MTIKDGSFNFNPFPTYFNMNPEELRVLLPLLKVKNIDLRNHMVDNKVI